MRLNFHQYVDGHIKIINTFVDRSYPTIQNDESKTLKSCHHHQNEITPKVFLGADGRPASSYMHLCRQEPRFVVIQVLGRDRKYCIRFLGSASYIASCIFIYRNMDIFEWSIYHRVNLTQLRITKIHKICHSLHRVAITLPCIFTFSNLYVGKVRISWKIWQEI